MLRKFVWVPVVALALLPAVANAQFKQGDWDLSFSGSGFSDQDFDSTSLAGTGILGYFFTDNLELNLRQGISYVDSEGGGNAFAGATSVGADWVFDLDRFAPYLGVAIGYRYGDGVEDDWFCTPEGGLKYFVNSTTYVFGSVGYQFGFSGSSENDLWIYTFGIGFRF